MFVTKGKINTSRFFSMMHHEESPEKPEYNMATPLFLSNHPPLPPFSSKNWGGGRVWVWTMATGPLLFYIARITPLSSSMEGDNIPVHSIPSCFKCFINGIELKHLFMYTQDCSGGSIVTSGSKNNFIWEYNVFKSWLTTLDHLPHLFSHSKK